MRRVFACLLTVLLLWNMLASCAQQNAFEVEYPEIYTPEYCYENYTDADPYLTFLYSAENSIGIYDVPGGGDIYYAIKDVPLDEYLYVRHCVMFQTGYHGRIVKNKNKVLPVQEVLAYKIKSVEVYSCNPVNSVAISEKVWVSLGNAIVKEIVAALDEDGVASFQPYIQECIDTGNYRNIEKHEDVSMYNQVSKEYHNDDPFSDGKKNNSCLYIRVSFEEYENLVWDAPIWELDGTYYISFCLCTTDGQSPGEYIDFISDGYWPYIYIPLNQEVVALIPQS